MVKAPTSIYLCYPAVILSKMRSMRTFISLAAILFLLLAGCTRATPAETGQPSSPGATRPPSVTPTPAATEPLIPTLAPTAILPQVCSPLAGINLDQLAGMIVNPYHPPKPGSDDPHQGVDLAVLSSPNGIALTGMMVQAILAGKVAGGAKDRFPYGNMLIIETPLDETLLKVMTQVVIPTPLPERLPPGALTCPELNVEPTVESEPRSLYVLYAHMQPSISFELGDEIGCGQQIGAVGSSGNALNPHLHVEVRVGPSGQTFASMAHYDPSAQYSEMAAYCTWRVSGVYQTIDPSCLWGDCAVQ